MDLQYSRQHVPQYGGKFKRRTGCTVSCTLSALPSEKSDETMAPCFGIPGYVHSRRAPLLNPSLQQPHLARRRSFLVQSPRSSLVARQYLCPQLQYNSRPLRRPLLGWSRTNRAQAPFVFHVHYGRWGRARLVVS